MSGLTIDVVEVPYPSNVVEVHVYENIPYQPVPNATRISLAANPDMLTFGNITRDVNSAVISAEVVWPDGTTGTFTALVVSDTFPGAIDSYEIDYKTYTYTQPTVTRDSNGAVIVRPMIIETPGAGGN